MQYLLDTNAIIRHFAQVSKLGKKAKEIIIQAESDQHQLFVSIISLMEIMYLAEKNRIPPQPTLRTCIFRELEERFVRRLVERVSSKSDRNALFTEAES